MNDTIFFMKVIARQKGIELIYTNFDDFNDKKFMLDR